MFVLKSGYQPCGDQPQAIDRLIGLLETGHKSMTLLGVTGSGKTFTMANIIARLNRPALVISHNKTLAAQLFGEFKEFFSENAVRYFVSYYDYYQPEAYLPGPDTYIEKDASINEELDRLRLEATHALLTRRDTVVVASVSCIYGIGSPDLYRTMHLDLVRGESVAREALLHRLVSMLYTRNDIEFYRGNFRVRGDVVEIYPAYSEKAFRIEFFGNEVDRISEIEPLSGSVLQSLEKIRIFAARHYVIPEEQIARAVASIRAELGPQVAALKLQGKALEAERLLRRTEFDIEMIQELGYCQGIENYSRHLDGRASGEAPYTLLDYLPKDSLVFIDESHVTLPQIRGMHNGDRSRKQALVEHGFRLPSAYDNRPLVFQEFEVRVPQVIYVSATPGPYEREHSGGRMVEQIIRPTGLTDPQITIEPARNQVDHLVARIRERVAAGERVLVTTLTKRMAEDLSAYLADLSIRVRYLHSNIETLDRVKIIRDLRSGEFDVLVGINLLREGLDLPEVSLVAILDADKEGFLRSSTSLIQTIGRAARHIRGEVILYADTMTDSIRFAVEETNRRRERQMAYNREHGITPAGIQKAIRPLLADASELDYYTIPSARDRSGEYLAPEEIPRRIVLYEKEMKQAAADLDFERAAEFRDLVNRLRQMSPLNPFLPSPVQPTGRRQSKRRVPRNVEKRIARRLGRET